MTKIHLPAAAAGEAPGQHRPDRLDYLRQTCELLWPPPASVTFGLPGERSARLNAGQHDLLLLTKRRPRLLIPASRKAGATAMRCYGEPSSRRTRLLTQTLALIVASGAGGPVLRSRVRVRTPPGSDTIHSYLQAVLGHDVLISTYLSAARANRKPVLQVLSARGEPVGFAKLGISPLTKALVNAERDALGRLAHAQPDGIRVPRVLHYGEWRGMNVLVLSTLPVWLRRRPVAGATLTAAMKAVANIGSPHHESLAGGSYLRALAGRLAAVDTGAERDALRAALDALSARAGDVPLVLGSWHGDWSPWNMASTSSGLLVWDWERFAAGVPFGYDALHYRLQHDVAAHREPREAAAACIEDAPTLLAAFGLSAREARITAVLYLAELSARYLADRQTQAGARLGAPGTWLIPAITNHVSQLL